MEYTRTLYRFTNLHTADELLFTAVLEFRKTLHSQLRSVVKKKILHTGVCSALLGLFASRNHSVSCLDMIIQIFHLPALVLLPYTDL